MFMIVRPTKSKMKPLGMDKNGDQKLPNTGWNQVVNWVTRSGYPDTIIQSNGLFVPSGNTVNISAQTYRGGSHSGNISRILANGVVIATGSGGTIEAAVSLSNYTTTADSLITLEGTYSSTFSNRDIVQSGPNTFLTITPV